MHSLNIEKYKIALVMPFLLMSICLTVEVAFSNEQSNADFQQAFSKLMTSASKENRHLLDGWNEYLIKVLGHSNAEHLKVIEELTMDYAESYKAFNEEYEKDREQDRIRYTSKWLDDVVAEFGQDFVCKNDTAVLKNLMMASNRSHAKKYDHDAKEIISKELILYLAYERYLGVFMKYYKQLKREDQKRMDAWKKMAEKYLSITKNSHFAWIYYGSHMKYKILDNVMQKDNKELYMYFKKTTLPFGSWAFNRAQKDMDMFVETCRAQGKKQLENDH